MSQFHKNMNLVLQPGLPLEAKFAGSSERAGTLSGYASTFGGAADWYGQVIAPGAFSKTIAKHLAEGTAPVMLWSHDLSEPIGKWTTFREDEKGLFVTGEINRETRRGREALALIKQGAVTGLSIGFRIPKGGRHRADDGIVTLTEIDLLEVSAVSIPANPNARILAAKSITTRPDFERFLKSTGFAISAAKKIASGGWPALGTPSDQIADELAQKVDAAAAELKGMT
jgi:HK97 family phage prohead protease